MHAICYSMGYWFSQVDTSSPTTGCACWKTGPNPQFSSLFSRPQLRQRIPGQLTGNAFQKTRLPACGFPHFPAYKRPNLQFSLFHLVTVSQPTTLADTPAQTQSMPTRTQGRQPHCGPPPLFQWLSLTLCPIFVPSQQPYPVSNFSQDNLLNQRPQPPQEFHVGCPTHRPHPLSQYSPQETIHNSPQLSHLCVAITNSSRDPLLDTMLNHRSHRLKDQRGNRSQRIKHPSKKDNLRNQHLDL